MLATFVARAEYRAGAGVPAAALGLALAPGFLVVDQDAGQLTSGPATDPNTGPLLAPVAIALIGAGPARLSAPQIVAGAAARSARIRAAWASRSSAVA